MASTRDAPHPATSKRVLRRQSDNTVQLVSFAGLGLAIALFRHDAIGAAVGLVLVALGIHTFRMGVYFTPGAVVVRNTIRTWRIPWADVERVDVGGAGHPRLPVVLIQRKDQPPVALWCLQPSLRKQRKEQAHVTVLQQVQRAVREAQEAQEAPRP
jgi:hypothetical protein